MLRSYIMTAESNALALETHTERAAALDFIVAFMNADGQTRANVVSAAISTAFNRRAPMAYAIAKASQDVLGIHVHEHVMKEYLDSLKMTVPTNGAIVAFLRRVHADPDLRKRFVAAATSHDAFADFAAANGLDVPRQDLEDYLSPFELLSSLLRGLLDRGVITKAQFEERAGFSSSEYGQSGMGRDVDEQLFGAVFSAAGWATKASAFSNLQYPIGVLVFPATAVMVGGLEGRSFTFREIGDMIADSFLMALQSLAATLTQFRETVRGIFG